jgi:hypothetical protein
MSDIKNPDGFQAKVEFTKKPSINLEAYYKAQEARAASPFTSDAEPPSLEEFDIPPDISLDEDSPFYDPPPASDTLRKEDLIFCDPITVSEEEIECPTCIKNPAAFVPDWLKKPHGAIFFDGTKCVYSTVVDAGIYDLPEEDGEWEYLVKANGVRALLKEYGRSEITTAIHYVLEGQVGPHGEVCDTSAAGAGDINDAHSALQFGLSLFHGDLAGLLGSYASNALSSTTMQLGMPPYMMGHCRILTEYDTIEELLKTPLKDDSAAVTVQYYVPTDTYLTTKALVSVDVEVFERTPRILASKPKIDFDCPYEVTISGKDFKVMFDDVARQLARANQYAAEAHLPPPAGQGATFHEIGSSGDPIAINFEVEAHYLSYFRTNFLEPAILRALSIPLEKLECVIIQLEKEGDGDKLKIKEVIANARGCPKFAFSEIRDQEEIRNLFNFTDFVPAGSRTLGYVAALPDMYYYLQGQNPVVWLEFLTLFTYPGLEIRNATDLLATDEDLGCIKDQTLNQLANQLLDALLGVPDMFLSAITEQLCHPDEEMIEMFQAEKEARALAKEEKEQAKEAKQAEKEWAAIQKDVKADLMDDYYGMSRKEAEAAAAGYDDPEAYEAAKKEYAAESKQERKKERDAAAQARKDDRKTKKDKRKADRENGWTSKFEESLANKLKDTGGALTNASLAKTFTIALVGGIDSAIKKKSGNTEMGILPAGGAKDLKDFQAITDKVLGGWCGYIELILQAMDCLLQGMGIDDAKKAVVEATLSSMTPYEMQKLTQSLPPETAARLEKVIKELVGVAADVFMPWEADYTTSQTFNKAEALEQKTETLIQQDKESEDPIYHAQIGDEKFYTGDFPDKLEEDAEKEVNEERKQFNDNRMKDASPSGIGSKLGNIQEELVSIFKDAIMDVVGIDTLFEYLNELPGFAIVNKFLDEAKGCLLPMMPNTNPPMDSFLKTLDLDLCQLGQGKVLDLTFPQFDPPGGSQGAGIEIGPIAVKTLFKALWEFLEPILIEIATQLLIQAITAIIEAVLDAICELLKGIGANAAQLPLKDAVCPDISDEEFADALNNVLNALSNGNPDNDCAANLTRAEMAAFIDAVMVTVSYNQLYNLLLCQASPETVAIVSELSLNLGSECIAEIFGNPGNVTDYFCSLGTLVGAEDIFDAFPDNVIMPSTMNVCPPETQDLVNSLRNDLLSGKGLSPEEIQDQIDFLEEQAANKLKDLIGLLDGPYKDLPALLSSGDCPPTGLIKTDPAEWMGFDLMTEAIFGPIESAIVLDLLGSDGVLNNILSDTAGYRLKSHRFFAGGFFGNPIGAKNFLWQFYSDDCINKQFVVRNDDGEIVEVSTDGAGGGARINQYGVEQPRAAFLVEGFGGVAPWSLFDPVGGFPPTIAAYLQKKLKTFELGLVDVENITSDEDRVENEPQPKVKFKTRHKDPAKIKKREEDIAHNEKVIRKRQDFIAKWAGASSFVDVDTINPYLLDEDGKRPFDDEKTLRRLFPDNDKPAIPVIQFGDDTWNALFEVSFSYGTQPSIGKRRAIFADMIDGCKKPLFMGWPFNGMSTNAFSGERRAKRILVRGSTTSEDAADASEYAAVAGAASTFAFSPDPISMAITAGIAAAAAAAIAAAIAQDKHISVNGLLWGLSGYGRRSATSDYNSNLVHTFKTSKQMADWFDEIADNDYGNSAAGQIRELELINPFELSLSYMSYGERLSPNGGLSRPMFASDLTYDVNLEDDDGNTISDSKYKYRTVYIEKINPFDEPLNWPVGLPGTGANIKEDQTALTQDNLDSLEVPPASPLPGNKFNRVVFDREISSIPSEDVFNYVELPQHLGETSASEIKYSWESEFLTKWLAKTVFPDSVRSLAEENILNDSSRATMNNFFDFINEGFVRRISKRIGEGSGMSTIDYNEMSEVAGQFGEASSPVLMRNMPMPQAFKFGYDVLAEPKAYILDPEIYGGTEDTPPYYLRPPQYDGWLGFMQKLLPERDACEPKRVPIYSLKDVKSASADLSGKLKEDKRMQFTPSCTKEAPYDAIFDKGTAAAIDGVIRVTARVYALDFMLRILPVISQFEINFEDNFDELLGIYLGDYTLERIKLTDIKRWWRPKGRNVITDETTGRPFVSGEVVVRKDYYANFLEEAGNLIARKIDSGIIDPDVDLSSEQKDAYENIVATVDQYYIDYDGTEAILSDEAIQAQDMFKRAINSAATRHSTLGRGSANFDKLRAERIKKGLLYHTLDRTEEDAKTLFSIYAKEELERFKDTLNQMFKPEVDSMDLLFLSHPNFINGAVKDVGPYDVMSDPEDPNAFNIDLAKFSSQDITFPALEDPPRRNSKPWPFVLEKYIRIEDKTTEEFLDKPISSVLLDRDENLKGIINLNDWQAFINGKLSENKMELGDMISDYFGPGEFELDENNVEVMKNTGFKFGLRLSILFDPESEYAEPFKEVVDAIDRKTLLETKAFNLSSKEGQKILIPLVNAELDVSEQLLSSFNIDQYDLPCLINEMIKTTEFKTLFRYVFPYRRYLSLFAIYVGNTFYQSIGNSGGPENGGDRWESPGGKYGGFGLFKNWDKQGFEFTGEKLMEAFLTLYNTRNKNIEPRDQNSKDNATSLKDLLADLIPSDLLAGMPWWQRRFRVDRPFDMFGNDCDEE